jgi:hypothetical protein
MMKKVDQDHYLTSTGKVVRAVKTIIFNVPECLQDEATELVYEKGHTRTEIGCEGIRSLSDLDGIVHRRREFEMGVNSPTSLQERVKTDVN